MVRFPSRAFAPVGQLRDEMNRLLSGLFDEPPLSRTRRPFPPVNVWQHEDEVLVEAELPGLKAGDLDISVSGDEMTLKGQRDEAEQQGATYHRRERGTGSFARVVKLPVEVQADGVEASLTDGVLLVRLPKAPEARPRKIEVKVKS